MTITPIEDLEKEVDDIEAYLSTLPPEDANLAIERGNELSVYIARTGKMLSDARLNKEIRTGSYRGTRNPQTPTLQPVRL